MDDQGCRLCPRLCGAKRGGEAGDGFCGMGTLARVARAAPHYWEEPCISGTRGSGAVFFCGCVLRCVFCQNGEISRAGAGRRGGREPAGGEKRRSGGAAAANAAGQTAVLPGVSVTPARLREIFRSLEAQGVHNLNLVSPTPFTEAILEALADPPGVPVVWNTGGYERVETLRRLEGRVQIYLPDMKYADPVLAARYSAAPDYPETAWAAIREMVRQTGPYRLDADGLLQSGVIIRHLILPGCLDNTFDVLDRIAETFAPGEVMVSLMSQYTPPKELSGFPELARRIAPEEAKRAEDYMETLGIGDGYTQELDAAEESYIPAFDLTGIDPCEDGAEQCEN